MRAEIVAAIEVKGLSYAYVKDSPCLCDISFNIAKGAFAVIAGANGSGKTTLLRHLNGLIVSSRGDVFINGLSVKKDPKRARRKVGMVFQDADSQIVAETVYDDVAFGPENLGWKRRDIDQSVNQALATVGLAELADQNPYFLSGGEKRRLAIAGVLAMKPDILVMDEPFANLDYPGVKQVLAHILTLHQMGHTIVISAHDIEKVIAHADKLMVVHKGCLVADGLPAQVIPDLENYGIRQPCSVKMGRGLSSWLS